MKNMCEAIVDGHFMEVPASRSARGILARRRHLRGLQHVRRTWHARRDAGRGKVDTLNYRTIRYPGHAAIMKALLNDLGLRHRRDLLKDILENALPTTTPGCRHHFCDRQRPHARAG